jgi:hypothetical protein
MRTRRFAAAVVCLAALCMPRPARPSDDTEPPPSPGIPPASTPGLRQHPPAPLPVPSMTALLAGLVRDADPMQNQFMTAERVDLLQRALGSSRNPGERIELAFQLAEQLLYTGRTQEAITLATPLLDPPPQFASMVPPQRVIREFLAVCYLRLGEQDNCIAHHGIDSCLLPIKGSGVHTDQRGSRAAIREITSLLQEDPGNMDFRWLLNIAAMTVGDYPRGVPENLLIPPSAFESEYDVGRFYDVASTAGVAVRGRAGGSIMEDFDGDGLLDLMVSASGMSDQLRYFHNDGDGKFTERTGEAGLTGQIGGLNISSADYDNDGAVDVLVLRGAWLRKGGHIPNSLLRNRGDGTFEDVTRRAGLLTFRPTQVGVWGDYDNDGRLDLFVGNESSPEDRHPCELWHNEGDGTFTDRSSLLGNPDMGFVKGAAWGDMDNDGRADLYVSVGEGSNRLFHNQGPGEAAGAWVFKDITARAGVTEPYHSFSTWFWDYDNDGWQDIFVAGYAIDGSGDAANMYLDLPSRAEVPRLYRNKHDGTFENVTHAARLDRVALIMGSNFGDLDNDGWLDAYLGTGNPRLEMLLPNRMFRNAGDGRFQDVTTSGGFGHLQKGHAVSFGDIDNDGDQDIHEEMGGAYPGDVSQNALYENPGHGGHWITLDLRGERSNKRGVGARVRVRVSTPSGTRDIYVTGGTGSSFGASSLRQEIGLGAARGIEEVTIDWPASGLTQTLRGLKMDAAYRVVEGAASAEPARWPRFDLSP